jgi:DNA polymerase-3 subunit epsilon/ATP-dependent DNA helicase DinG
LETTGLNTTRDTIIEIGAVKFDDRRELGEFHTLINPGRPIPLQITQLTGITDRDVLTAPAFSAVRERLSRFVGRATVVGHNVGFDLEFLRKENCLTRNASVDTFQLATILMPHESRYSLGKLIDSLGISYEDRHRALSDAIASMKLFRALQERAAELPGKTLQALNRAARGSRWPLRTTFQQAERSQAYGAPVGSIGAQLRAKGLIGDTVLPVRAPVGQPLIPVDCRTALDVDELATMLEEDGSLARSFPGFEYRPEQVEMLRATAVAFNQSSHLMVEAGTGVGKSIAYLLPAVYWAVQNGERVVVSTNTINLQEQLSGKDLPDLRPYLPFEVRSAVLKGRNNYLCRRRLDTFQNRRELSDVELQVLAKVLVWLPNTVTGDRTELFMPDLRERGVWPQICSDADTCSAERCVHRREGTCFFYRARAAAENAHVVIVNHALLLSDVATENRVLPQYNYLIVDEAHHLESATTHQLGYSVTYQGLASLLARIGLDEATAGGYLQDVMGHCRDRVPREILYELGEGVAQVHDLNGQVVNGLLDLFDHLKMFVAEQGGDRGQYDYRVRLSRSVRLLPEWEQIEAVWERLSGKVQAALEELTRVVDLLGTQQKARIPGYDDLVQDGAGLCRQLGTAHGRLESILTQPDSGEITWVQARSQRDEITLWSAPLRVGHLVEQHLLWPKEAVIFTSATLRTNGDFSFIRERLGAADADELAVGSPFDYESQVLLCFPTDIPEPNQPYYQKTVNESLYELARATQGRMLVLFTSYSQLRAVNSAISRPLAERGITVYAQGQGASRSQLLENLRTVPKAVLLGTRSFWEGIDVPGEALSCLAIVKLPFAVPSDPIFAARSEDMDDPFRDYAVPDAILRFRQGFGRLIRTKADRGAVVMMDRRLQTKRYGEMFVRSLPSCTTVHGPLTQLPRQAALWIDKGIDPASEDDVAPEDDEGELEYVSFDDL